MEFSTFSNYLQRIENTSSRNEITEVLSALFKEVSNEEIDKIVYLSLGNLGPLYDTVKFGISDKMMFKVLTQAFQLSETEIQEGYKKEGDLGDLVFQLKSKNSTHSKVEVIEVFEKLCEIAALGGKNSQQKKIEQMAELFNQLNPLSAKYVARIPLNKLRLGFSDVTILDALSWMIRKDKSLRPEIERAYNVSADIGKIARLVKEKGIRGLESVTINVGIPIRPAAAERLPGTQEIIKKLGEVMAEPKIDGFRLQCHYDERHKLVKLFSRNLEDMTEMFPEIIAAIRKLEVNSIVFEGEAVAFNPNAEEFLPFQETVQRRRKYNIKQKAQEIPLKLFAFDLLYLNGKDYLKIPLKKRKNKLAETIGSRDNVLLVVEGEQYSEAERLSEFFLEQLEHGLEGIMVKRLDAEYAAGARNFNWVKLKREEKGELTDSIDCVVMGYKLGTGKRVAFGIGAFLVGVYDHKEDVFKTISKVGTGLTDDQWQEMKRRADILKTDHKPARYDIPKELEQDVWVKPGMVVEILADEITRSPVHTAGKIKEEPGYALRFPRLVKWRDDKKPEQATSVTEIKSLFKQQKKRGDK